MGATADASISGMLIIAVDMIAAPGQLESLKQALRAMIAPTLQEDGCLRYQFYQDQEDPNKVLFYEHWRDQAAIDAHFAAPHFVRLGEQLPDLLAEDPVIKIYQAAEQSA